MTEHDALEQAILIGKDSPCAKSKRGVVIWKGNEIKAYGVNRPPIGLVCTNTEGCRAHCSKLCLHAEQVALNMLTEKTIGLNMLHVKVIDGKAVPSGPPSCWQCSRGILDAGIETMWLLHENGLKGYSALEFHYLTLEHCHFLGDSELRKTFDHGLRDHARSGPNPLD